MKTKVLCGVLIATLWLNGCGGSETAADPTEQELMSGFIEEVRLGLIDAGYGEVRVSF